jgi:threonyl-tRNA synthetase
MEDTSVNFLTHQELGQQLKLFFFDEVSPGSAFFLPHGTVLYNKLLSYMRSHYQELGYKEVITPVLYDKALWQQSGHWDKYKENMFCIECEDPTNENSRQFSNKPMNCPGHCVMFKQMNLSYRDLPLRLADFGVLHRNEIHGSLRGLTRVRKFCQDDAHIFCKLDQVEQEIQSVINFMKQVYKDFELDLTVGLSTRPDQYIGDREIWDRAELILKNIIKSFPEYTINDGDGAFYGPKLDFTVKDSLGRSHQLGTIQLDFNLPERFDLTFKDWDAQQARPVMIHRAILGSVERFIGILLEATQGHLPWLVNPRQIALIPIKHNEPDIILHCKKIYDLAKTNGIQIDWLDGSDTMQKKVAQAEMLKYCYIVVVGKKEVDSNTVNVRGFKEPMDLEKFINSLI